MLAAVPAASLFYTMYIMFTTGAMRDSCYTLQNTCRYMAMQHGCDAASLETSCLRYGYTLFPVEDVERYLAADATHTVDNYLTMFVTEEELQLSNTLAYQASQAAYRNGVLPDAQRRRSAASMEYTHLLPLQACQ